MIAFSISIECIIEIFVSIYENKKIRKDRQQRGVLTKKCLLQSILAYSDSSVKASMANYWRNFRRQDGWHFTRRSEDIKSLLISNLLTNSHSKMKICHLWSNSY